jgi:hydrogenase/urease accessory protein HupE
MNVVLRLALIFGLVSVALDADAHAIGVSQGRYTPTGDRLQVELALARSELLVAIPALDADADGELVGSVLDAGQSALEEWIDQGLLVQRGLPPCHREGLTFGLIEADGIALALDYPCGESSDPWRVQVTLLDQLTLGHRHLATVGSSASESRYVLYSGQSELLLAASDENVDHGFVGMIAYGVEHILTGYDHLLFVLGLMLLGGRRRDLFYTVTAFTLAHSITLAAASLQWFAPSPDLVEPLIALTIAWVGVENWLKVDPTRRWRLSLLFGLIHGFGFAGALGEAAIAPARIPTSLLAFNIGVEAGQLLVLSAALPALYALRRLRYSAQGIVALNAAIVLAGLGWFVQRVGGF